MGYSLVYVFIELVRLLIDLLIFLVLARVVLSWILPHVVNRWHYKLIQFTDIFLNPIRQNIPSGGMFDYSPLLLILLLEGLKFLIRYLLY